jgi:predicted Rossmann-fold nucleotide-binding protein
MMSDAYVVAPGGIGTLLESAMIWQLLQVRHLNDVPLIFMGSMWHGLVEWASTQMLQPGFELAKAEDMRIPQCVDTADEAIAIIREHQSRWRNRRCDGAVANLDGSADDGCRQAGPNS